MEAVQPLGPGDPAPPIEGHSQEGAQVVFFYKVTCPVCQLAAPIAERFHQAFPERFAGVGQDPPEKLDRFAEEFGTSFPAITDEPPYTASSSYGIRIVPTIFVLDDGRVVDTVESWDRDGWNRAAAKLGALTGQAAESLSWEGDGLPPFRPG